MSDLEKLGLDKSFAQKKIEKLLEESKRLLDNPPTAMTKGGKK